MQINEVIERHGMQLRDVSRQMGMKPSALESAIGRNLTVKTLRLIAEAAKIPIAEFFLDELTDEEKQSLLAVLLEDGKVEQLPVAEPAPKTEASGASSADDLPFKNEEQEQQPDLTADIAFICPHCHEAIKLGFVK